MDGWIGSATLLRRRNDNIWSCNEAPCCSAAGWQLVLPNAHQATVNEAHSVVKTEIKKTITLQRRLQKTERPSCVQSRQDIFCVCITIVVTASATVCFYRLGCQSYTNTFVLQDGGLLPSDLSSKSKPTRCLLGTVGL